MSHIQIAMFIIGGVLVLAGLVGLVPVMRHHEEDEDLQTSQMAHDTILSLTRASRATLTPAAASPVAQPPHLTMPEPAPAPAASVDHPPALKPPPPLQSEFDAGMVEELFAELFALRLSVDSLRAEVRALRQPPEAAQPPADARPSIAA